jgi:hypothetical protein
LNLKKDVQNWLKSSLEDPIAKMLAKNSHLTAIQLETLLIDVLASNLALKSLKYEEKAKLRQTKAAISRGSFNRTLRQAKTNVIRSIYTILLLGYFGIIEDSRLTPYIEVANSLKTYGEAYKALQSEPEQASEQLKILSILRSELREALNQLSGPWSSPNP